VDCLESWIRSLEPGVVVDPDPPVAGDAFTVASRVKYLLDGGALTREELEAVGNGDGTVNNDALESLAAGWMWGNGGGRVPTAAFFEKRRQFLELTLQQNPASRRFFYQLRNAAASGVADSLNESFIRTAERIVDEDSDFRTIASTNEWEVTTLVLLALTMTDHPTILRRSGVGDKNFLGNNISEMVRSPHFNREADAEDWRTVTLITDSREAPAGTAEDQLDLEACGAAYESEAFGELVRDGRPRIYDWTVMHPGDDLANEDGENGPQDVYTRCVPEHAQQLRAIREGDYLKLRAPRVGFFTTPSFFATWETNADNQFRVTVNQAMIIGTGRIFSPGDATGVNTDLSAVDPVLFPATSECFGCHKNLDRMRTAFTGVFDGVHSRYTEPPEPVPAPDFAFQGQSVSVTTLQEWAVALASHPEFARAWVLKLCQWANSIACDPGHEEVLRLAEEFEASGYQLNELFLRFFSSRLVSDTSFQAGTRTPGAQVSIARRGHYCHAMRTRLLRVNEARDNVSGQTSNSADLCALNGVETLSSSIPNDQFTRGTVEFNQPKLFGALTAVAFEGLCTRSANALVESRGRAVFDANEPSETLDLLTSHMLGFPAGSARFETERSVLQDLFDAQAREPTCADADQLAASLDGEGSCGLGLSNEDALRNVWSIVCQSPTLTGLGL
ncbi:MAG: hypothetical protein AAGE52_24870, partial [Myxococcota bacterium]